LKPPVLFTMRYRRIFDAVFYHTPIPLGYQRKALLKSPDYIPMRHWRVFETNVYHFYINSTWISNKSALVTSGSHHHETVKDIWIAFSPLPHQFHLDIEGKWSWNLRFSSPWDTQRSLWIFSSFTPIPLGCQRKAILKPPVLIPMWSWRTFETYVHHFHSDVQSMPCSMNLQSLTRVAADVFCIRIRIHIIHIFAYV
jgi:hypothetical protein